MNKSYTPDVSPYEPAMGDIVIYRDRRQGRLVNKFPAIVVKTHEGDRCDLTVFSDTGVRYVLNVKYSSDDQCENSYGWAPPKEARVNQTSISGDN